jgi:hypothetical protein
MLEPKEKAKKQAKKVSVFRNFRLLDGFSSIGRTGYRGRQFLISQNLYLKSLDLYYFPRALDPPPRRT